MNFQDFFYSRLSSLPERGYQEFPREAFPETYRAAAVLMPFWPEEDSVKVAFTLRTDTLPSHKGQVSFPGGSRHAGDGSSRETALRETEEELGISRDKIDIKGRLDDAWSGHGFHITPYAGWIAERPEFRPHPAEVSAIIIADVQCLMQPEAACVHRIESAGQVRTTHAFSWEHGYVWGITADILLELFLWVKGESSNRRDMRLAYMKKQLERGDAG